MPSEWKQSGLDRRDFRHTHNGPEIEKHKRKRGQKKKWCKGVEGVRHIFDLKIKCIGSYEYSRYKCKNCGREEYRLPRGY